MKQNYSKTRIPGCGGAVNCMKPKWKSCPSALKGQYFDGKDRQLAVIQVEAWCDRSLYVWSWFRGRASTNNDLKVLAVSPLFVDILIGLLKFTSMQGYLIVPSGIERYKLYFLADGIYPDWPIFAKPISNPYSGKTKQYKKAQ